MPGYRKQVVTFLDIMGFREIVKSTDADRIVQMLDLIQAKAAAPGEGEGTSVISFSDSIIRARPCGGDLLAALIHEVGELATAQWDLMDYGILVRGGTTIGDVLVAPARAFGPAFVRAYEMESSWARSPRIVLDPATVDHVRESLKGQGSKRDLMRAVRASIAFDRDGLWFVDYIGAAFRRLGAEAHREVLARHRNRIIASANALKWDSPVWAKYLWLIRYFNTSCKALYKDDKGLKILRSDVPFADELLIPAQVGVKRA